MPIHLISITQFSWKYTLQEYTIKNERLESKTEGLRKILEDEFPFQTKVIFRFHSCCSRVDDAELSPCLVWANHPWTALQHLSPGQFFWISFNSKRVFAAKILATLSLQKTSNWNKKHVPKFIPESFEQNIHSTWKMSNLLQILFDLCQLICLRIHGNHSQRTYQLAVSPVCRNTGFGSKIHHTMLGSALLQGSGI